MQRKCITDDFIQRTCTVFGILEYEYKGLLWLTSGVITILAAEDSAF